MPLTPDKRKELLRALEDAFPTYEELEQMVSLGLDEKLQVIIGQHSVRRTVFLLVEWMEGRGRLNELIKAAHEENPRNELLDTFVENFFDISKGNNTDRIEDTSVGVEKVEKGGMVLIPAGEFMMGKDNKKVYLDSFYIDIYPVTNIEYKKFVVATNHKHPSHWVSGTIPPGLSDHPVVGVNWFDAQAFAEWVGKELPTSAQWEKAARGIDGRRFPWGNIFDPSKANTRESSQGGTTSVRNYPEGASPYGVLDMIGNVWEWTSSKNDQGNIIIHGGAWDVVSALANCFKVLVKSPRFLNIDVGFRCIKEKLS